MQLVPITGCTSLLRAPVSEMTYTVSSGTLNSTIPYHSSSSHGIFGTSYTCMHKYEKQQPNLASKYTWGKSLHGRPRMLTRGLFAVARLLVAGRIITVYDLAIISVARYRFSQGRGAHSTRISQRRVENIVDEWWFVFVKATQAVRRPRRVIEVGPSLWRVYNAAVDSGAPSWSDNIDLVSSVTKNASSENVSQRCIVCPNKIKKKTIWNS